ncbi:competence protein ComFA [Pilibacter termitis]|uniref:Competence protein ComFA n=1 Tax=Pilibacter termitis TaxID=263852 RepID=A0A1T4MTG1_9ENTE|nr:DEAD/DEAH box helicase [Pilibacter termitis]SJZ70114.1 competence protein ComFA [Pilibacter termitis]
MELRGRRVNAWENPFLNEEEIECFSTMEISEKMVRCMRCGGESEKDEVKLPKEDFFCPECIELGRIVSSQTFFYQSAPAYEPIVDSLTWKGELTKGQQALSEEIVCAIEREENLLIHAVTGAGKTEMIFAGIARALSLSKRVGIAIPRVDVCIELYPRIQEAFSGVEICLLHGKSEEEFRLTPIVICTTHQLLRFFRYFDVCIVDEADAFPFAYNQSLAFALENARKEKSSLLYLTATPTKELKRSIAKHSVLPARFHQHPLVVPEFVWCGNWRATIEKGRLPKAFKQKIKELIEDNFPFLIFCPVIALLPFIEKSMRKEFPHLTLTTASSIDEQRLERVKAMRERRVECLITTTILERGVTFADISVLVLGSNHKVYNKSVLVQISGRVGRKLTRPNGKLYFLHDGKTKAMTEAKREILEMNKLAKERNLLLPDV